MDRSREYWMPERIWTGQTCFLLGGGPSLRSFDCNRLKGRRVIAINSSCHIAPWADVLFFIDNGWFDKHRAIVENWPGLVISHSRTAKIALPDKVKRIELENRPEFALNGRKLKSETSSGHIAISLAIALGATRVVLLGYDMRRVVDEMTGGVRSHHHDDYSHESDVTYTNMFIPKFAGWNDAAKRAGVTIFNCTDGSALHEFQHANIEDFL